MQDNQAPGTSDKIDRWTDGAIAFIMSMVLPGVGQLWKRNVTAPWWLFGGAVLVATWQLLEANGLRVPIAISYGSYAAYCVLAGLHAVWCGPSRAVPH